MTYFIRSGDCFSPIPGTSIDPIDKLPNENFVLKYSQFQGFYLEMCPKFALPSKVYGKTNFHADRILNTFKDRGGNTGVLLMGEKGSGKSLLAKQICVNSGYPSIVINDCYTGDQFNSFLSGITQPCVVFFDEFEKVYDYKHQQKILTLLDGTFNSNKLFLLTSNDRWGLDTNMCNRPGRIYYMLEFKGLDKDFIVEYCNDRLEDTSFTQKIVSISKSFDIFNFDLLSAFVEEVNRYKEEPKTLLELLNAKPRFGSDVDYDAYVVIGNSRSGKFTIYDFNIYDEIVEVEFRIDTSSDNGQELKEIHHNGDFESLVEMVNQSRANVFKYDPDSPRIRIRPVTDMSDDEKAIVSVDFKVRLTPDMASMNTYTNELTYEVVPDLLVSLKKQARKDKCVQSY